ncbi:MAG: hypothetical protein EA398_09310 [Deltaproteobacteria bacterium]|nr:MAG: hypothetical protein EA398_09310 [Deltaproteobacteria bacterium]
MNALPPPVADHLRSLLHARQIDARPVHGGSIHSALHIRAGGRELFLKLGRGEQARASLEAEHDGLHRLARLDGVRVPIPLALATRDDWTWLALPWIDTGPARLDHRVGELVATLHDHSARSFGLERDNCIALLHQPNPPHDCGDTFWARHRLRYGCRLAREAGALHTEDEEPVLRLADLLESDRLPAPRGPVWLHGDLWQGNVLVDTAGLPWLIDPAVYAGDPRVDLAMARLFGGFEPSFFDAWYATHGRRPDDDLRDRILVLWPLLVHAALFGASYGRQTGRVARQALAALT